jgi:hypothetical protein
VKDDSFGASAVWLGAEASEGWLTPTRAKMDGVDEDGVERGGRTAEAWGRLLASAGSSGAMSVLDGPGFSTPPKDTAEGLETAAFAPNGGDTGGERKEDIDCPNGEDS